MKYSEEKVNDIYHKAFPIFLNFLQEVRNHFDHPDSGCISYPDGIRSLAENTWKKYCELEA